MKILKNTLLITSVAIILSACAAPVTPAIDMSKYRVNRTTLTQIISQNKQPEYIRDVDYKGETYTLAQYCQSPNAAGGWTAYGMSLGVLGKPYSSYQAFLFKDNVLFDMTAYDVESASTCGRRFKDFEDMYFGTLR